MFNKNVNVKILIIIDEGRLKPKLKFKNLLKNIKI